jgi:hypothetical protein
MKNTIKSIAIAVFILGVTSLVVARANYQQMLINQSQYYTGTALVNQQSGSPASIVVTGYGSFQGSITSPPTGVVINSQTTPVGTIGYTWIRVGNTGVQLKVDYTSPNIVVTDQQIVF